MGTSLKVTKFSNHYVNTHSGKALSQLLDNISEGMSTSKTPGSGIYTITSEMMPDNICQTNQCESSATLDENSSSNQDTHANDNSNQSYSRTSSPGRCSPKDDNNNCLRF